LVDEVPGMTETVASVTESIANAAHETVNTAVHEVDILAEVTTNAIKNVMSTNENVAKTQVEDDFFDNLENGEG
jgi:hypothetical protein